MNNVLLLFHVDGKLKGTMCLYKMSLEFVIDWNRVVEKNVIARIAVMFVVCYVFYKDILCV